MRSRTSALALAAALVLAGCGGGGGDTDATSTGPGTPEATATPGDAGQGEVEVVISDFAFMPEHLEVPAGTTITWTNQDDFAHTVTSGTPEERTGRFDMELGETGEHDASGTMASYTVEEPGEIAYFCRLHPRMTATIAVTDGGS